MLFLHAGQFHYRQLDNVIKLLHEQMKIYRVYCGHTLCVFVFDDCHRIMANRFVESLDEIDIQFI